VTTEILLHRQKARSFVAQAAELDAATKPEAVIHLSYYAMYHAAAAALLARTGSVPARHAGIIGQFGLLVRNLDDVARRAGKALNVAFDTRVLADYDIGQGDLAQDARQIQADSAVFLKVCDRLIDDPEYGNPSSL
jgi:uncharacterized protein (UPF0332 family)